MDCRIFTETLRHLELFYDGANRSLWIAIIFTAVNYVRIAIYGYSGDTALCFNATFLLHSCNVLSINENSSRYIDIDWTVYVSIIYRSLLGSMINPGE